jgi:hypothetical protein
VYSITTIDTCIPTNYTNDAYIYDIYLGKVGCFAALCLPCITIIDTIILTNYTNDAYTYETYLGIVGCSAAPCLPSALSNMYHNNRHNYTPYTD